MNPKPSKWWGFAFLGTTIVAIVMEVYASVDNNPTTYPWTDYITQYISADITFLAICGLFGWLLFHFGQMYGLIPWGKK